MCEKVNRVKLKKLYSIPSVFKEITFMDGLNIILGEKSEDVGNKNKKTNGVGKSVCIDFINFGLLKSYDETRLSKISPSDLDTNTIICLDLEIGLDSITIKRKISSNEMVTFVVNGETYEFAKIKDAINYIETKIFKKKNNDISYRSLISSVTREEKTNFDSILRYYSNSRIPNDPTPLLYMLNIDIENVNKLNQIKKKYDKKVEIKNESKKSLIASTGMNISEIKAELNEKENNIKNSTKIIEMLKSNDLYKSLENEVISLEKDLKSLCEDRMIIKSQIKQIESLPAPEKINEKDLKEVYNYYKNGLGDYIIKSLEQVNEFKSIVEKYQETLLTEKIKSLKKELNNCEENIRNIDKKYGEKIKLLNQNEESFGYLESGLTAYNKEKEEYESKRAIYNVYNQSVIEIENIKADYAKISTDLLNNVNDMNQMIESLEKTLSDFHYYVMGDRFCSLNITTDTKITTKNIVNAEVRITDDGSFSVDRIKVFLYDISLMFNEYTRKNHPKFLIHDNIFHFDNDSTEKCLELLINQEEKFSDFQYIVTLNIDDFENLKIRNKLSNDKVVTTLTKSNKFLGKDYKEK